MPRAPLSGTPGCTPVALAPFRTFGTQQQAYDYSDSLAEPLRSEMCVFAEEVAEDGRRRFIATTAPKMWAVYELLAPTERHHYEIIRQGRPCHLYFDLEYSTAANPGLDGPSMVVTLMELVALLFKERFNITLRDEWVLELDSSTPAKFSRHVLVRVRRAAFADNSHVNAFVALLVERMVGLAKVDARFAAFVVRKRAPSGADVHGDAAAAVFVPGEASSSSADDPRQQQGQEQMQQQGQMQMQQQQQEQQEHQQQHQRQQQAAAGCALGRGTELFVDTAVYTRNRAFRLYLSSKLSKRAVLRATARFGFGAISGLPVSVPAPTPAWALPQPAEAGGVISGLPVPAPAPTPAPAPAWLPRPAETGGIISGLPVPALASTPAPEPEPEPAPEPAPTAGVGGEDGAGGLAGAEGGAAAGAAAGNAGAAGVAAPPGAADMASTQAGGTGAGAEGLPDSIALDGVPASHSVAGAGGAPALNAGASVASASPSGPQVNSAHPRGVGSKEAGDQASPSGPPPSAGDACGQSAGGRTGGSAECSCSAAGSDADCSEQHRTHARAASSPTPGCLPAALLAFRAPPLPPRPPDPPPPGHLPATYRPPTDHLPATYRPPTDLAAVDDDDFVVHRAVWFASLVCHVDRCARRLTMYDGGDAAAHQGFVLPGGGARSGGVTGGGARGGGAPHDLPPGATRGLSLSHGPSPFPLLDAFVASVANQGGVQGSVRNWAALPDSPCLLFNIKSNRWCGNVNGPHKSNGIFFVVDAAAGVWYQKCYDPQCRSYRSEVMPLPSDVWQSCRPPEPEDDAGAASPPGWGAGTGQGQGAALFAGACGGAGQGHGQGAFGDDEDDELLLMAVQQHEHSTAGRAHAAGEGAGAGAQGVGDMQGDGQAAGASAGDDGDDDDELLVQAALAVEAQQQGRGAAVRARRAAGQEAGAGGTMSHDRGRYVFTHGFLIQREIVPDRF
ncbi:hypothetical protein FOA52_009340 [Chlamydomonas sp. UWO 241]|nr:hypothetical protein FOA52_009340 [Chlamydomonas sp. UWO 241]